MKVAELSRKSGVPLPTIKFYIREGLLPAGSRTGKNQADYGPRHLERLAMIRVFRDDVGLPIDTISRALRAADKAGEYFVVDAIDALVPSESALPPSDPEAFGRALDVVVKLAKKRGWMVNRDDVSVRYAARALEAIGRSFYEGTGDDLVFYAEAVDAIADCEIPDDWAPDESPDAALRYAVLGTVLFEPFILALRRMAHVARTRKLGQQRRKKAKARAT